MLPCSIPSCRFCRRLCEGPNQQSSDPQKGEPSCPSSSHPHPNPKESTYSSNRKVVSRTRRTACRIYRRQPRIRCEGVRESVAKARPRVPELVEATQHSAAEKWSIQNN